MRIHYVSATAKAGPPVARAGVLLPEYPGASVLWPQSNVGDPRLATHWYQRPDSTTYLRAW